MQIDQKMTVLSQVISISLLITVSPLYASISGHNSKMASKHYRDYIDPEFCLQEAVCQPVHNATCFGTTLPYTYTSVALAEDSVSHFEVQDNLALWQGLRSVPRCWAVVQPLLCAVYMPKCENGSVFLPSQEMCRITRGPCKSVEIKHSWPFFLRCENKKLFPPRCRNPLQEVKFNTSYKCMSPLVETDNPDNWFHEVEGCGIQCQNPFFTAEEHSNTHHLISILASACFGLNLISVATFVISWKAAYRYPGIIIFYVNISIAIATFAWLIQFFPGAREEIVCLHDGTIRRRQPRSGEHLCSISFVLIYFFLMASILWCVILAYAWHLVFKQSGAPKDILKKKVPYFHLSAWCIPVVLTTTIMAMKEVDGDSMSGICFVGYNNINTRISFLLAPVAIATLIGGIFLSSVLYTLIKVKLNSANLQVKKIRQMVVKIGSFTAFMVFFITCTFACHAYDFFNRKEWDDSLREYIVCLAMNSAQSTSTMGESAGMKCKLKSKPSIFIIRLHLFCVFGFGIMMSLWVWTRESLESWKRFVYRICEPVEKNPLKIKRHRIIAEAFKRRREINQGHLSFSFNSTHEDPIGMNLDMNSVASRDISSSWAAALPQFLMRRNAVTGVSSFAPRHYSSVSDVSRHISVDSFNQPNLDSLSMQISEQEYVAHALRHQRRKTRKERERFLRANRIAPWFPGSRRGSDTSLHSSLMSASIAAVAAAKNAALGAKVTKATSTGDLGAEAILAGSVLPPILVRGHSHRSTISREPVNPPFTHGMTDNSHRLGNRNISSALGSANTSRRLTPNPLPSVGIQNPLIGMSRPPVYAQNYNFMNSMPFGYVGGGVYPSLNGIFPGYPPAADFMYNSYNSMSYTPFGGFQSTDPSLNQYQQPLLPMDPRADSASETDFFPIFMSESEFTDTGFKSYDESHVFSAQRFIPEQVPNCSVQSNPSEVPQPKPGLEPQECAKTQFLKRMGSFSSKNVTAISPQPAAGRTSPHSEAPPPSPAESVKSLNDDDLDDVFEDSQNGNNDVSSVSLPQTSEAETLLGKLKSKFKRVTSQNLLEPETLELSNKPSSNSSEQVPNADSKNRPASRRNTPNEKLLTSAEGTNLLASNETGENVSR